MSRLRFALEWATNFGTNVFLLCKINWIQSARNKLKKTYIVQESAEY